MNGNTNSVPPGMSEFDWATLGITSPALGSPNPSPEEERPTCTKAEEMTTLPGIEGWSLEEMFPEMATSEETGLVVPEMQPVVPPPPHRPGQTVCGPDTPVPSTPPPVTAPTQVAARLESEILRIFTAEELRDADRGEWAKIKAVKRGSLSPAALRQLSVTRRKYCGRRYANKQRNGRLGLAKDLAVQVTALTLENEKLRVRIELLEGSSTTSRYHTITSHPRPTLVGRPGGNRKRARTQEESSRRIISCWSVVVDHTASSANASSPPSLYRPPAFHTYTSTGGGGGREGVRGYGGTGGKGRDGRDRRVEQSRLHSDSQFCRRKYVVLSVHESRSAPRRSWG